MAQRPIWRGHLRLALVSCPVALYSANHDRGALHFHLINPATGNRVRMITQDADTGDTLTRRDLVKGYEYKKGSYLLMDEDDFDAARVESSSTVKVEKFVDTAAIDPIYFDSSYYMAPDGDAGADVYVVLRDAIAASGKIALSRVVIARRERAVAIMPLEHGLVVHTLHETRDLNDFGEVFDTIPAVKPDAEMVQLATQLIQRQVGRYDADDIEDRYEARLRALIEAKIKGEGLTTEDEPQEERSNVVDLMAALRKSLGQGPQEAPPAKKKAKPPAKAAAKPAASAGSAGPAAKKPAAKPAARKRA